MNWYLVSVRPNKRDLFLKHLDFVINKNQLEGLFIDKISPTDPMYKDMVLIKVSDFQLAQTKLRKLENFQRIEPRALTEKQLRQFFGKK